MKKSGLEVPEWMLSIKGASNKRWKEIEKRPVKRKTISTDIKRNTNKRFQKILVKDAKKLGKLSKKYVDDQDDDEDDEQNGDKDQDMEEGGEELEEDDDEEINSDEY